MNQTNDRTECAARCRKMAAASGIVFAVLCMVVAGAGLVVAIIAGVLFWAAAGYGLTRYMCPQESPGEAPGQPASAVTPAPAPAAPPEPTPEPAPAAAPEPTPEPTPAPAPAAAPEPKSEPAPPATASVGSVVQPSKPLPGQQELADRKGSWRYQGDQAPD